MKTFLMILTLTVSLASTLSANDDILGLGMVKVAEVTYIQDGEFYVTLTPASAANPLFFNNEPTLSFQFHPDNLDGICVIVTPDQEITRRDIVLLGPSFINLILSNMASGQAFNLSCGFTQMQSDSETASGKYALSYFQVNSINE